MWDAYPVTNEQNFVVVLALLSARLLKQILTRIMVFFFEFRMYVSMSCFFSFLARALKMPKSMRNKKRRSDEINEPPMGCEIRRLSSIPQRFLFI